MNEGEDEDLQEWNQHGEYQPDFYHLYVRCGGQALTHTQEQGGWNFKEIKLVFRKLYSYR